MEPNEPLPPWPKALEQDPSTGDEPALAPQANLDSGPEQGPSEEQVARWLLDLGGRWLLCGRNLMERHLVTQADQLPPKVSALLGAKLPPEDPRTDAILERLASASATRGLQQLDLARSAVGPAGLQAVAGFAWLEALDLSDTSLSLEDLAPLKGLPELTRLDLAGTPMGLMEHADIFGQSEVPAAIRHPLGALQRSLARLLDLSLVGLGVAAAPSPWPESWPTWTFFWAAPALAALILLPLEAMLLATLGSTPGKAFLRVSVVTATGSRPSLAAAMLRSGLVYLLGWAAGLRPLSWGLGILRLARLAKGQVSPWDERAGTRCIPRGLGTWRVLLAGAFCVAAPFLPRYFP